MEMKRKCISNIHCVCGRVIQAWRYAKRPGDRVSCKCGAKHTLCVWGKPQKKN